MHARVPPKQWSVTVGDASFYIPEARTSERAWRRSPCHRHAIARWHGGHRQNVGRWLQRGSCAIARWHSSRAIAPVPLPDCIKSVGDVWEMSRRLERGNGPRPSPSGIGKCDHDVFSRNFFAKIARWHLIFETPKSRDGAWKCDLGII